jgi:hypothetical protein
MKAIISTTLDDKYLFFLPIVNWCWNQLGVEVICFRPFVDSRYGSNIFKKEYLALEYGEIFSGKNISPEFYCPEHKGATYSQVSRLYAAALNYFPHDEVLITSDIDMAVLKVPPYVESDIAPITIFGTDLVPTGQYPMCYASAKANDWKRIMKIGDKTFQECLDEQLAHEEMENMRGNLWCRDQELLFKHAYMDVYPVPRARPGTQFASNRYDRDDSFLLDRLSPDTIDYHLPRPGYEENNFNQILTVLKYHYPNENFDWMVEYRNQYIQLL